MLNAGDRRQLLCLRGIGAKRADAILALRGATGGGPTFRCKEDLAAIGVRGKQARGGLGVVWHVPAERVARNNRAA